MKLRKTYSARISGNANKINYIESVMSQLTLMSQFVFDKGKPFWYDFNYMYKVCRSEFPELNSKILQNFLQKYRPIKGKKLPKCPIQPSLSLDYQNFNFRKTDTALATHWLRFNRKNFPVFGKYLADKVDPETVKFVEIVRRKNRLYANLTTVVEIDDVEDTTNPVGLDINAKRVVLSNRKFYHLRRLAHRKREIHRNKLKLQNYTKDICHKLTTQIVNDLRSTGSKVLVLEDLTGLRNSASKKKRTSKGRHCNHVINGLPYAMIRNFLEFKCLEHGITVQTVNPAYTSKQCNRCKSKDSQRPTQPRFVCNDCGLQIDADLNGSRNILERYTRLECVSSESHASTDLKS